MKLSRAPMRRSQVLVASLVVLLVGIGAGAVVPASATSPLATKLDPRAMQVAELEGRAPVIAMLAEQADTSAAARISDPAVRRQYMFEELRRVADRTQPRVLAWLAEQGIEARGFWIVNSIALEADAATLAALARHPGVGYVELEGELSVPDPSEDYIGETEAIDGLLVPLRAEDGIRAINADEVWDMGYTGEGTVVGIIDTGANWLHPALKYNYRGRDKDHDYDWGDAAGTADSPEDQHGHGTHVTGIAVGEAGARQIGVAPGAEWIVCRNMVRGSGDDQFGIDCVQWMFAPTKVDGSDPKPELAPDVVNASWGSRPGPECAGDASLNTAIVNLVDAGTVFVAAAGNSGNKCETVCAPGSLDISFTVANYEVRRRAIHSSSSRGPVKFYGEEMIKPDISAPGQNIYSSIPPARYDRKSGTSMASPHVAGAVALLLSARPELRGRPHLVQEMIEQTASELQADKCGPTDQDSPNNAAGYGLVDIEAAVEVALSATPPPTPTSTPTVGPSPTQTQTPTATFTPVPPTNTPGPRHDIYMPWVGRRDFLERALPTALFD